jgi:hypothetical protein
MLSTTQRAKVVGNGYTPVFPFPDGTLVKYEHIRTWRDELTATVYVLYEARATVEPLPAELRSVKEFDATRAFATFVTVVEDTSYTIPFGSWRLGVPITPESETEAGTPALLARVCAWLIAQVRAGKAPRCGEGQKPIYTCPNQDELKGEIEL